MSQHQNERVQRIADRYFHDHELEAFAPDVEYVNTATGEVLTGRDQVEAMLDLFYHTAFDADAEITHTSYGADGTAIAEYRWRGTHIGEFAGIDPTDREVQMDLCVIVEVGDEYIEQARLYAPVHGLINQLQEQQ